jgi:hypothetical protein
MNATQFKITTRNQLVSSISALRTQIRGRASAGLLLAFFGAAWWGWGVGGIQGLFSGETTAFYSILVLATGILVIGGIFLLRAARRLPRDTSPAGRARDAAVGKRNRAFGMVFALEMVIIALGVILLNVFHHPEFRLPFVTIVVGVHFLPLARLFAVRLYSVIGILFVLVGVIVVLAVPVSTMIGNLLAWDVLVGSTCAFILWLTGIYSELRGRGLLRQAQGLLATESANDR